MAQKIKLKKSWVQCTKTDNRVLSMLINYDQRPSLLKTKLWTTCEPAVNKLPLAVNRLWVISSKNLITANVNNASAFCLYLSTESQELIALQRCLQLTASSLPC